MYIGCRKVSCTLFFVDIELQEGFLHPIFVDICCRNGFLHFRRGFLHPIFVDIELQEGFLHPIFAYFCWSSNRWLDQQRLLVRLRLLDQQKYAKMDCESDYYHQKIIMMIITIIIITIIINIVIIIIIMNY